MKNLTSLALAVFCSLFTTHAIAGVCWDCKIESMSSGVGAVCNGTESCVLIRLIRGIHAFDRPACSTSTNWHFVLDTATPAGRTLYAQILIAQQTQRPFAFIGSGSCTLSAGSENLIRGYNPW